MKRLLSFFAVLLFSTQALAGGTLLVAPRIRFLNANAQPLGGGLVTVYQCGTSIPITTYQDSALTTPNTSPVVLDSLGAASIYFTGCAKVAVTDYLGTPQPGYPVDNVLGIDQFISQNSQWVPTNLTPTYLTATTFSVPGNVTNMFAPDTRMQLVTTGGTVYGTSTGASFGSGVTTVTVSLDSGSLTGVSAVSTGILTPQNSSVPAFAVPGANRIVRYDSAGRVNTNAPAFEATLSANQTGIAASTWTKVAFNTKTYDTNNNYDAATNYRFTPTVAGKYLISAMVIPDVDTSLTQVSMAIYKNGVAYRQRADPVFSGEDDLPMFLSTIIDFNGTTDYVEIWVWINGTTNRSVHQMSTIPTSVIGSFFSGCRVGI